MVPLWELAGEPKLFGLVSSKPHISLSPVLAVLGLLSSDFCACRLRRGSRGYRFIISHVGLHSTVFPSDLVSPHSKSIFP